MSDKDLKVYHVRNRRPARRPIFPSATSTPQRRASGKNWKRLPTPAKDRFLALTGKEAAKVGLADALIDNRDELAKRYGLNGRIARHRPHRLRYRRGVSQLVAGHRPALDRRPDRAVHGSHGPGHGVGGLVAAACFLLLFWSHFLGGTADWLEVLLFIVGLACIAVEIFLLPGTIVPGLTGAALILVSVVMASQGFLIPETPRELHTLEGTLAMLVVSCGVFAAAAVVITRRMESLPLLNRLTLAPPDAESARTNSRPRRARRGLRSATWALLSRRCVPAARAASASGRSTCWPAAISSIAARRSAWCG